MPQVRVVELSGAQTACRLKPSATQTERRATAAAGDAFDFSFCRA
jgi:hypothetical protein